MPKGKSENNDIEFTTFNINSHDKELNYGEESLHLRDASEVTPSFY